MPPQLGSVDHPEKPIEFCHRNPMARDFVIVSRVVLLGYPKLSDGAKVTYWVVYSHDWYEPARGRKGFAFPTIGRLARLRHTSGRTVQRHLAQLIAAGLLTRELRPGRPSVLYIEEPNEAAVTDYLAEHQRGGDIPVGGGVTKLSPHNEEENKQRNSVNAVGSLYGEERGKTQPQPLRTLLPRLRVRIEATGREEWLAQEILGRLGDPRSLGCYRTIAARCPQTLVFEALALVKDADRSASAPKNRGALFVTIVRRLCAEGRIPDPLPTPNPSQALSAFDVNHSKQGIYGTR
jgi:hypothetical protein